MPVLSATNVRHSYGHHEILQGCSITVEPGERVGLVGRNGAGKTTLLRALAGMLKPDSGEVTLQRGSKRGYLAQDPELPPDETLRGAAEAAFAELHTMHRELDAVFQQMAGASEDELHRLLARQADLEKRIETAGGFAVDHRIDAVLHGLGFTDAQFDLPVTALSGGQRARVALARLLLEDPSVILLDEPTNHLDIEGRLWLESFLAESFNGAVVMISHDRYLLDRVVDRIVEVEQGRLIDYPGNYTKFRELRAERRESMLRAYEKEQHQFKREEAFIRKYKTGQRAKQARGRESRLDRARSESTLEKPLELDSFRLSLPKAERTGDIVASVRELTKIYPASADTGDGTENGSDKILFRDLTVSIGRGERWGVVGPNGAGKTTLVRTILGEVEPTAGKVVLGTKLKVGYFRQTHEGLDPDKPLIRQLQASVLKENPDRPLSEQEARDLAGAFLFSGGDQEKEVAVLSGGERARLMLASLLASAKNVLVLDEPTNHLDIPSAERLEQALSTDSGFEGTLILISHDRALIDATCDHLLVLDGRGGVTIHFGNYTQWRQHLESKTARENETAKRPTPRQSKPSGPASNPTQGNSPAPAASSASSQPDEPKRKSKFSWMRSEQIEERMSELEPQLAEIDEALGDPDVWREPERANDLTEKRDALKAEIAELEEEWLRKSV